MDVNDDFLFSVICYIPKGDKCEFMDAEIMGRKLVRVNEIFRSQTHIDRHTDNVINIKLLIHKIH